MIYATGKRAINLHYEKTDQKHGLYCLKYPKCRYFFV